MYIDTELELADSQAVTASAASTNIIDFTHGAPADVGVGDHLYLVVQVDTAATAGGAATVTFALQTDDNSSFSSATALWTSATIAKATLVAGYKVVSMAIPEGVEQYLRLYYTVATGPLTAGAFSAFLTKTPPQSWVSMPDAT
jgi:hypothetical protein